MASENRPTYNVACSILNQHTDSAEYNPGCVGFGSWSTRVEYKDFKMTVDRKNVVDIDNPTINRGDWHADNGILTQKSAEAGTKYIIDGTKSNNYTLEFKARKTGGEEGFLIYDGMQGATEGYVYNVGGWNNQKTVLQQIANGNNAAVLGERLNCSIETSVWYNIKLVVKPHKSELYINDELVLSHTPKNIPLQSIASGYDDERKELVIKVVNGASEDYNTSFKLDGTSKIQSSGKVITLRAENGQDENSLENPYKIFPVESEFNDFGKKFSYNFHPFSYTVLRIKVE